MDPCTLWICLNSAKKLNKPVEFNKPVLNLYMYLHGNKQKNILLFGFVAFVTLVWSFLHHSSSLSKGFPRFYWFVSGFVIKNPFFEFIHPFFRFFCLLRYIRVLTAPCNSPFPSSLHLLLQCPSLDKERNCFLKLCLTHGKKNSNCLQNFQ